MNTKLFRQSYRSILFVFAFAAFALSGFSVPNAQATISSVTVLQPDGTHFWRGMQDITWTDSSVATPYSVFYSTDFSTYTNLANVSAGTTYTWDTTLVLDDTYRIKVRNNLSEEGISSSFTIDNTPPTTTISDVTPASPGVSGWYNISTGAPTITLSCTDDGSGCGDTFYSWDGGATVETYSTPFTAPEGDNTLTYWSEDNAVDNTGAHNVEFPHNTQEFKVDTQAPSVTGYTLNGGTDTVYFNPANGPVDIGLTADEPVTWTTVRIQDAATPSNYKDKHPGTPGTDVATSWDGTLSNPSAGPASDGTYELTYNIEDVAGNTTDNFGGPALGPSQIVLDSQNPSIDALTLPTADAVYRPSDTVPLDFTVSDPAPGTDLTCSYSVNGSTVDSFSCPNGAAVSSEINKANLVDGRNSVVFTVTDQADNSDDSSAVSFVYDNNQTLTVGTVPAQNFDTVQEALSKAIDGDTVFVTNGSYSLGASTLNVNKEVTLQGESEAGVTIDGSGIDGYGLSVTANNVTLETFTLLGPATGSPSGNYGVKASHIDNFSMQDVTVKGSTRSEVDLNTVTNSTLQNVTANGQGTDGVGVGVSHSSNITLDSITTMGNNWGGVGLFDTTDGPTTDITFTGTNSFAEPNKVYIDTEFGNGVFDITLPGFTHAVENDTLGTNVLGPRFVFFQESESDAVAYALSLPSPKDSYIQTLDTAGFVTLENHFIVANGMGIQAAVDHASAGALVDVGSGTYDESVLISTPLMLSGNGVTKPVITGLGSGQNYIVEVDGVNDVSLDNVEINGGGSATGDNAFDYGLLLNNAGTAGNPTTLTNSTIKNVWKTSANGIGVEDNSYLDAHLNTLSSFQKRGIRFIDSDGVFYANEVIGDHVDGTSRVQNLVNLWGGSNVEVYDNILHDGMSTTPGTWDSPAVFVSSYGGSGASNANIHDNQIYNVDTGITVGSVYAATDTSTATIQNNYIHDVHTAVNFEKNTASASIHLNQFTNTAIGVGADDGSGGPTPKPSVDAEKNWWGDPHGPTASTNPGGVGAQADENVDYSPWCLDPGCTMFGSNDPLDHITLDLNPTAVTLPGSSAITITAYDHNGFLRINEPAHVALIADGGATFNSNLLTFSDGVATASVSNTVAGTVNVTATIVGGAQAATGQVVFSTVAPSGTVATWEAKNNFAQADDSYLDGWHYTFHVTVYDMNETNMFVKFSDWVNTASSAQMVAVSPNTHLLINEAGGIVAGVGDDSVVENGFGSVKSYALGNDYSDQTLSGVPTPIDISAIDDDPGAPGRQVQFDVFTKIPLGTAPGFYETSYGIDTEAPVL